MWGLRVDFIDLCFVFYFIYFVLMILICWWVWNWMGLELRYVVSTICLWICIKEKYRNKYVWISRSAWFSRGFKGIGVFGILVICWCWWGVDSIIWGKLPCEIVRLSKIVLVWLLWFWCFWGWDWWTLLHVLEFVKPGIGDYIW